MISLFEAPNINGKTLMEIMKLLLVEIQLRSKVIACVKDEGKNLTTLNVALFQVMCFSWGNFVQVHVMSKACQYAPNNDIVCQNMKEIFSKEKRFVLQNTITWTKKLGKGKHE
jgi:hypothetical protein